MQEAREACTVAVQSNGFDVPAPMGSGAGADEIAELRRLLPGQEIISTILDTIQVSPLLKIFTNVRVTQCADSVRLPRPRSKYQASRAVHGALQLVTNQKI